MNLLMRMARMSVLTGCFVATTTYAGSDFVYWPDGDYDSSIPTVESVLGYRPGERITWHRDAVRYFQALAEAAPEKISVSRYGTTWEGRELIYAAISSKENLARVDEIQAGMRQLKDPRRTPQAQAEAIIESQPAVTWLSYGVHGNEISSTDAAMLTAYHLLASRGDPRVVDILRDTVVVIDPMQNPDGRDRFVHHFETSQGLLPDADSISAEHDEPWPSGRVNHYLFDLNRDWFIQTQPETQGRIEILQQWYPVAFVDAHEMGSDGTYYFAPEADPYNPHLAADQQASLAIFGRNNARWFDTFGFDYFTREIYDAFYPGYGASWPSYFGSIAMTYEQASPGGLVVRQYDGNELTYAQAVRNHFVTSLGTAETVAANRVKFLTEFYDYQVSAIDEGARGDIRAYILPVQSDQAGVNKLAGLLVRQGIEVREATAPFNACGETYGAGTFVINMAQPAKRQIRTLLDSDVPMKEDFLVEQERRRAKKLPDEIYDVTAWSLPLMMNVRADACHRSVTADSVAVGPESLRPGTVSGAAGSVGYLVPWGSAPAVRLLSKALSYGLSVKSSDRAFTHQNVRYPSGTLILDVADNPDGLKGMMEELAAVTGAAVTAVDDSWVSDGPNFGSGNVVRFNSPRVAIVWDAPTAPYSAGSTRFVIERQFDFPVSAIRTRTLAGADLSRYQVLILPEAFGSNSYSKVFGEAGTENLKDWIYRGGVLIGLGNANRYLADPKIDLLAVRRENAVVDGGADKAGDNGKTSGGGNSSSPEKSGSGNGDKGAKEATVKGSYVENEDGYQKLITPEKDRPDAVAGVLVKADVDPDHWLGAGVASTVNVLLRGSDIYTPIRLDKGMNVVRFRGPDALLASGYLWEENRKQLAYKPFVVAQRRGKGYVIGFTQDPNVRAYLDGLNVIFMNAIFRGSAHARPVR